MPLTKEHRTKLADAARRRWSDPEFRARASAAMRGPRRRGAEHNRWQGDAVGYGGVHQWLQEHFGHEKITCECCGTTDRRLEWAWLGPDSMGAARDRNCYSILCKSCHQTFDLMKQCLA